MTTMLTPTAPAGPPEGAVVAEIDGDTFFAMIEAGLFAGRRVFLWDGRICEATARSIAHATTALAIQEALRARLPRGWLVWPENPLRIGARHAPLPDLTVIRGPLLRYRQVGRHPLPEDVGLLVEVAVSSLPKDLGERAEEWARGLIPSYWVADVVGRRIIEHESPQVENGKGQYGRVRTYQPGDEIRLVLDGHEVARIPIAELLS